LIKYRKRRKYKYNLAEDYFYNTGIDLGQPIQTNYLDMTVTGELKIRKGYAWDGPSGPTRDTPNFMRASLVHDALYQLMRSERLNQNYREKADQIMLKICREAGMSPFRSKMVFRAVRLFGGKSAKPDLKEAP